MKIEVSNGEIVDKHTITSIKLEKISDPLKLKNLKLEFSVLEEAISHIISTNNVLYKNLLKVNQELWDIEDKIRDLEYNKDFGNSFIETARLVYITNDKRSEIKRQINESTGSYIKEEKSYNDYLS